MSIFNAVAVACVVATVAFWAYSRTLLPGVDLGDTGGFQAAVLWPETSARQGYPLYYALAEPFVGALSEANPARGLNLFSSVWAAVSVGLLTLVVSAVTRSLGAAVVSGLLLAFSYTFWTQAVIAEVCSLHLALLGSCLLAQHAFAAQPMRARLALFFGLYALSFGNHLSMILFFVPFTVFLLQTSREPRELFRPAVVSLAVIIAAAGTLQYIPDFVATSTSMDASDNWSDRIANFWFDVSKADWRELSVLGIHVSDMGDRLAMWLWDMRQQFGLPGLALAGIGVTRLWWISRAWAGLVSSAFLFSTLFPLTYNLGDTHVFFLPGHFLMAFAAGAAVTRRPGRVRRTGIATRVYTASPALREYVAVTCVCVAIAYAVWRGWSTWPAADRHLDRRASELVTRLTLGVSDRHAVLVTDLDWQTENAVLYASRFERPDLTWVRLADVFPHFPFFVRDNQELGRDVLLTERAASSVVAAYGPALLLVQDDSVHPLSVAEQVEAVPVGAPYVLCLLTPPRDERLDPEDVRDALLSLTGGALRLEREATFAPYEVVAGVKGQAALLHRSSTHPFTQRISIAGEVFEIRMDSWLPTDAFRRGGFGHVLRGREQMLIVERGSSLAWIARDGSYSYAYTAGLYAPERRFRIPAHRLPPIADAAG